MGTQDKLSDAAPVGADPAVSVGGCASVDRSVRLQARGDLRKAIVDEDGNVIYVRVEIFNAMKERAQAAEAALVKALQPQAAQPVAYRAEWNGDVSDEGAYVYCQPDERDFEHQWEPLYANPQPPAQGAWQPIETAPKDGTDVLLWEDGEMFVSHWGAVLDHGGRYNAWLEPNPRELEPNPCAPTHWMPLLAPPAMAKESK